MIIAGSQSKKDSLSLPCPPLPLPRLKPDPVRHVTEAVSPSACCDRMVTIFAWPLALVPVTFHRQHATDLPRQTRSPAASILPAPTLCLLCQGHHSLSPDKCFTHSTLRSILLSHSLFFFLFFTRPFTFTPPLLQIACVHFDLPLLWPFLFFSVKGRPHCQQ